MILASGFGKCCHVTNTKNVFALHMILGITQSSQQVNWGVSSYRKCYYFYLLFTISTVVLRLATAIYLIWTNAL